MRALPSLLLLACVALASPNAAAQGGGVRLAPVMVSIPQSGAGASLRIDNSRSISTAFEVDVYAWTQVDGLDVLAPTRALAAAPTVFELAPGVGRTVRLALAPGDRTPSCETAYRVILRELPLGTVREGAARVVLELSVPVFVAPGQNTGALSAWRDTENVWLSNEGRTHVRLVGADIGGAAVRSLPRYLLAQSAVRIGPAQTGETLRVKSIAAGETAPRTHELDIAAVDHPAAVRRP